MRSGSFGEQQTNSIFVLVAMFPEAKAVPDVALRRVRLELLPLSMPAIKCQHQIRAYLCEWKSVSKSVRAPELDCECVAGESINHLRHMSVASLAEDADPLTVYQDERVQHGKGQPVYVLEKRLEGRICGQSTIKGEVRVGEWILLIKDRFIAGQVAPDFGARDPSRNAPEE